MGKTVGKTVDKTAGNQPRIVSLLPSATEIVCALGLKDALVGRSHECDFPGGLDHVPMLSKPRLDITANSGTIDRDVKGLLSQGLSIFEVDAQALRSVAPDIIITQSQCEVCAVTPEDLTAALHTWTGTAPSIISLAPNTLAQVWQSFLDTANALEVPDAGQSLVQGIERRLAALSKDAANRLDTEHRPTVACIEWLDPLMIAGNWVPELVHAAGGHALLAEPGAHSAWLDDGIDKGTDEGLGNDALTASDPDAVVVMPCGFDRARSHREALDTQSRTRWIPPRALAAGHIAITDGHQYFNRPGPRLVDSVEILVEILHSRLTPQGAGNHYGHGWTWLKHR